MKYLSIIIPCHNEQFHLRNTVTQVIRYGEYHLRGNYDIILVENGSTDETFAIAQELERTYQPVRAYQIPERSKAAAVKFGMLASQSQYRYMCDADLSTPIIELNAFLREMKDGAYDIVIASREHFQSHVETTFTRWAIGRLFAGAVQVLTGMNYSDTQCGFKLFNAHAAVEIFSRVKCSSMAFDVETLYLAEKLGYYATDLPVTWKNDPDSRVRLIRDSWLMFKDLVNIRKLHGAVKPLYKGRGVPA